MKIIFLDIDGVLNSSRSFGAMPVPDPISGEPVWQHVDPEAIRLLNQIVERTGAQVVVSSSWRLVMDQPELTAFLKRYGFVGEIIDYTPTKLDAARGTEIKWWLDEHGASVKSFVILDDDNDMHPLHDHLVLTSFKNGLEPEHVEAAVQILDSM